MDSKLKYIVSVLLFLICMFVYYGCVNNKSSENHSGEIQLEILSDPEIAFQEVFGSVSEEVNSSEDNNTTVIKTKAPVATNAAELEADRKRKEEILEAFKNSNYKSCSDILDDYIVRLNSLRKGDIIAFAEFPISTDPTIKYCQNTNPEFRTKLDSLQKIGKQLVNEILKEYK
jgi:hypothetical protein